MAVDKQQICDYITRGGQVPATGLVPTLGGYQGPTGDAMNPEEAKRLLDEARADGVEIGTLEILVNSGAGHETIANTIAQQWKQNLGVDVETRALEWGTYLSEVRLMNYEVARAGWIGDYPDPNTFLDMFVTDGENNQTGWSNARYDECIRLAATENDPEAREALLAEAEGILIEEMPILPIYFYVSVNVVRTYVDGFYPNAQDIHDLSIISIDQEEKQEVFEREGLR